MEQTLQVGESCTLVSAFFGKGSAVVYAGMPSESTYSLAVSWGRGYQAAAYNLYLPLEQRELNVAKGRLRIHTVTPREIRFSFTR